VPNYVGPQRFGRFGRNAVDGYLEAHGERVPGGSRLRRFFVAALQSQLFNLLLAERVRDGSFATVVTGDWARKHDTGGTFEVVDAALEAPRALAQAISATIPLYGSRVRVSAARPEPPSAPCWSASGCAGSSSASGAATGASRAWSGSRRIVVDEPDALQCSASRCPRGATPRRSCARSRKSQSTRRWTPGAGTTTEAAPVSLAAEAAPGELGQEQRQRQPGPATPTPASSRWHAAGR
jgi:tRNA(Glu) U13 pseudouridine synthase TruD